MEGQTNKETFKLLQLSDDSKSLSDLELPEITTQRKRKVRRKTRPRPAINRQQDVNSENQCNRLITWIAIFLTCCWLLTLSYMFAVIHAENTRLEVQIKKIAMTSQNLPDALQKWHETSKSLEQNQTIIYGKIADLQHRIEELNTQLSLYENKLNEKKDYSKDEQVVANFGAKVEAVAVDVERMKERLSEFEKIQSTFKSDLNTLKSNFSEAIINATSLANNNETQYSQELLNAKSFILDEIKSVAANLSIVNDTLSQKNKNVEEEIRLNKENLEIQADKSENITANVVSLKLMLANYKTLEPDFVSFKNYSNIELERLKNATEFLKNNIREVRTECNKMISGVIDIEKDNSNKSQTKATDKQSGTIKDDTKLNNTGPILPTDDTSSKTIKSNPINNMSMK